MSNKIIDQYLKQIRRRISHLPIRKRDAVLQEIKDHLEEETRLLRKEDKQLSKDEAALQATNKFGDPDEISVAYGPDGGVVKRGTGEVLLDVAVLTSRGVGNVLKGTLKWTGIVALIILATALVVSGGILWLFQDTINDTVDTATNTRVRTLVEHDEQYEVAASMFTDSFEITNRTVQSRLSLSAGPTPDENAGCLQVSITAPDGSSLYDSGQVCLQDGLQKSWSPVNPGTYQVRVQFTGWSGELSIDGWAEERFADSG